MADNRESPNVPQKNIDIEGTRDNRGSFWPTPPYEWVEALRGYLRDYAEDNDLLDFSQEHSDKNLREAWGKALVDWNASPPLIPSVDFAAHPARFLLLLKACVEALRSVSFKLMRNELSFNAGSVTYDIRTQWQRYERAISAMTDEYEQKKAAVKVAINMGRAFGDSYSEFSRIGIGLDQAT